MQKSKGKTSPFVPDTPLSDPRQDLFNRWPFAQRLARAIASRTDPSSLVVAVYGAWGDGKTSLLNFVETELAKHDDILCIRFNPWRFGDESQLLLSFFSLLAESLGKSLSTHKEKIGEFLQKYGTIVAPFSLSLAGVGFSTGQSVSDLGKQLSGVELHELRSRIEKILDEAKKRVVILIDDIDRLDKTEIQAVFKLVKLTADFDHTAYVLAFDDVMVARALGERYASGNPQSGFSFLEKIVQVPLNLPHADQVSLRHLCFKAVDQALNDSETHLDDQQAQTFVRHFNDGLQIRLTTPRMCKRYGNALSFALPILKGEVNPVDLMLVEGVRVFYPQAYAAIRDNGEVFSGSTGAFADPKKKDRTEALLTAATESLSVQERAAATSLLKALFPQLSEVLGGISYSSGWGKKWAKEQRVCSPDYFARYFTYSVPAGDVSDLTIIGLLEDIREIPVDQSMARLRQLITPNNVDRFVQKLREREASVDEVSSELLSKAIVGVGDAFPNPERVFGMGQSPRSQAAMLVHKLLLNIADRRRRLELAEELIQKSTPLTFCFECLRWMTSSDRTPEEDRTFSKTEDARLGTVAATRIRQEARGTNLLQKYGDDAPMLLWSWAEWGNKKQVAKYLENLFKADKANLFAFLQSYLPTGWSLDTGICSKGDFMRNQFDSVAHLIDPKIIMRALGKVFGDDLKTATPERWEYSEYLPDKRVAFQFAGLFNHVEKEKKAGPQQAPQHESKAAEDAG